MLDYELLKNLFYKKINAEEAIKELQSKKDAGLLTYISAYDFSDAVSGATAEAISELAEEILSGDNYDSLMRLFGEENYRMISEFAKIVQTQELRDHGLQLNPLEVPFNENRASGLANEMNHAEDAEKIRTIARNSIGSQNAAILDETIIKNADFLDKSGVKVTIIRLRHDTKACPFCDRLAGSYGYAGASRLGSLNRARHNNCKCTIQISYAGTAKKYTPKGTVK